MSEKVEKMRWFDRKGIRAAQPGGELIDYVRLYIVDIYSIVDVQFDCSA